VKGFQCSHAYSEPKRHILFVLLCITIKKISKDIEEELINKVNPRINKIRIKDINESKDSNNGV